MLLLCAAAAVVAPPAAHAQTRITQTVAFASVGSTTPLTEFDAMSIAAEADGSRTFQLDLIAKSSSASVLGISVLAHVIPEELEIIAIDNIASAVLSSPSSAAAPPLTPSRMTLNGVSYAMGYQWGWAGVGFFTPFLLADTYARLLTATFKLKRPAGNTTLDFSAAPGGATNIDIVGEQFTIMGPPLASVSITPRTMQEIEPFKVTTVTCGLSRPALEDTACTLGVGDGSTADPDDDYRVEPALANATITIPKDMESADSVFTFTPNIAGDGGTIDVELSNAVAGGEQVIRDDRPATFIIFAPGLIPGPLNGPVGEVLGNRGGALQLRAEPRSDVIIDLTVTEGADEVDVNPKTPLTFTTANWSQPQNFFVRGEDDRYDDGDQPFKIVFAVNEGMTRDTNYHDILRGSHRREH